MPAPRLSAIVGRAVVRDEHEEHRAATTLELFFDLVTVVAIGRIAAALHHELAEGHITDGIVGFCLVFFAVWWAWMNFTWFATAHDSGDVTYRLLTFLQIGGALIIAAGVSRGFLEGEWGVLVGGFVVMRIGLVLQWLRVAAHVPEVRTRALRYAGGLVVLQVLWIGLVFLPGDAIGPVFIALAALELTVPYLAERATGEPRFHVEHIEERYGLLTIIVLGESILSATAGFQDAFDNGGLTLDLFAVGLSGLVIACASWWLYFDHPGHLAPTKDTAFRWGYGHVLIFAALPATGVGIHVSAGTTGHHPHGDTRIAALALAIPVTAFLVGLVVVMLINRARVADLQIWPKLIGAASIVVVGAVASVPVVALFAAAVAVALCAAMVRHGHARAA